MRLKNKILVGCWMMASLASAKPAVPSAQSYTFEAVRERLAQPIDQILQKHCGKDCPGFRIEPKQIPAAVASNVEDLGFSMDAAPADTSVKAAQVTVLVQNSVPTTQRKSLEQILNYRLANELDIPVSVQTRPLTSPDPIEGSRAADRAREEMDKKLAMVREAFWPITLLVSALIAFVLGLLYFRHQRKQLELRRAPKPKAPSEEAQAAMNADMDALQVATQNILASRSEDLHWLIEERSEQKDSDSLARIASLFSPAEISSNMKLTGPALHSLANLGEASSNVPAPERVRWLNQALDQAHWRRLEETENPIAMVQRLPDTKLISLYRELGEENARATLLSQIPNERWANLLGKLSSDERVDLGVGLYRYQNGNPEERAKSETMLLTVLRSQSRAERIEQASSAGLEDYSLLLPSEEGMKLWQRVQGQSGALPLLSLENVIESCDSNILLEVSMEMSFESLQHLMTGLSYSAQQTLVRALPSSLKQRLAPRERGAEARAQAEKSPTFMRAKAEFYTRYRRLSERASV